jgi:hypothetical protein
MKIKRENRDVAPVCLWTLPYVGVGGRRHTPSALAPGKRPGTHCIVHEAECARGPIWTNVENLAVAGTFQPVAIAMPPTLLRPTNI